MGRPRDDWARSRSLLERVVDDWGPVASWPNVDHERLDPGCFWRVPGRQAAAPPEIWCCSGYDRRRRRLRSELKENNKIPALFFFYHRVRVSTTLNGRAERGWGVGGLGLGWGWG